ncbi:MAG: phosphopantothenoylcysteine decarboxylase, partial [Planctomycetota bacterium]
VWTHLAVVVQDGVKRLYVNKAPTLPTASGTVPPAAPLCVGADALQGQHPVQGLVDEVRVFTFDPGGFNPATDLQQIPAAPRFSITQVTLLTGPTGLAAPEGVAVVGFTSVEELKAAMAERFGACDALVMAAAVGDFRAAEIAGKKISRKGGAIEVRLVPTEDLLATIAAKRQAGQRIVAFAVETGTREEMEEKARGEMKAKGADFVVVNTPEAMGQEQSQACVLSPGGVALEWDRRAKDVLAAEIVRLLER